MYVPMVSTSVILGSLFLVYGVFKIIVSVLALTLPSRVQARLKGTPLGLLFTNDRTAAGRAFDYTLIIYALYSILHGLTLLGCNLPLFEHLFMSLAFKATIYIALGLFLVIYYSLVLYTDMPISKTLSEYSTYQTYILLGVVFLLTSALVPFYGRWM